MLLGVYSTASNGCPPNGLDIAALSNSAPTRPSATHPLVLFQHRKSEASKPDFLLFWRIFSAAVFYNGDTLLPFCIPAVERIREA